MAFYRKNIGGLHQMMRIVVGLAAAAAALIWLAAPISYLAAMMGVALVISGLFGYCPTCDVTPKARRS